MLSSRTILLFHPNSNNNQLPMSFSPLANLLGSIEHKRPLCLEINQTKRLPDTQTDANVKNRGFFIRLYTDQFPTLYSKYAPGIGGSVFSCVPEQPNKFHHFQRFLPFPISLFSISQNFWKIKKQSDIFRSCLSNWIDKPVWKKTRGGSREAQPLYAFWNSDGCREALLLQSRDLTIFAERQSATSGWLFQCPRSGMPESKASY